MFRFFCQRWSQFLEDYDAACSICYPFLVSIIAKPYAESIFACLSLKFITSFHESLYLIELSA